MPGGPARALSALTVRGRCVIGGGLALALAGVLLGEQALVQLAVFVLALPVLAALSVARGRFQVTTSRTTTPPRVPRGTPAEVLLELGSTDPRRGGLWLLTEQLPPALGPSPRFTVAGLRAGGRTALRYAVTGRLRGVHELGPLRMRVVDPFGLVERTSPGSGTAPLVVVPRVWPLAPGGPGTGPGRSGTAGAHRAISTSGDDDIGVREYRRGDDLRKVHWRATARTGELMVRLEDRPSRARGTLLLDTRARAHLLPPPRPGAGSVPGPPGDVCPPADSLEWLVEAAASIGVPLARRAEVRVVTAAGELPPAEGRAGLRADELLDRLATVRPSRVPDLDGAVAAACRAAGEGPLICLLGAVGPDDVADLVHLRTGPAVDVAVLLDVTGWADPAPARRPSPARDALTTAREEAAAVLSAAGWRVALASADRSVAEVWAAVGEAPRGVPA